ncbi:MAG: twin-arginine translocation signal domain-containing protein, partial [Opitutales bacterium]|nr:twin-arginine translocation signal domain-containing protein [Opitutales bacterium]
MGKITRRDFLKKSTAAAFAGAFLPTIIPATALGKGGVVAPSERIVFGCIGVGSQMRGHRDFFAGFRESQVIAVCDVRKSNREDSKRAVEAISARRSELQSYKGCDMTEDYLDIVERDDIDAVA